MKPFFQKSVCVLLLGLPGLGPAVAQTPRPFAHPDRIRYDAHCLTIDGRDVFIFSGAFHYFRCPKELWRDRFQKIKDAGFNCVETYIPWNWSEPDMPADLDDFSKANLAEADDFMAMAESFGLYVIARPGPYICAEWDTGGFPQWLLTKRPAGTNDGGAWLRSDDPVYLAWCKHWYDAVCPVIARHQITRKPPGQPGVILVQLENEYDYAHFSDVAKLNQLRVLGGAARADGVDVPLITCWTAQVRGRTEPLMRQIFDCANFYPRWDVDSIQKDIERLRREQPDAPLATTELQGGWFSKIGEKLSEDQDGLTGSQINNLTLFAIQNGETILNYYMLVGGTNPGDRAARDLTATYDYAAPIREWGGVGERYQRVRALGRFLREHGARLARSEPVGCDVTVPQNDVSIVMRRTLDGGRYLFVRTSQHAEPRQGTAHVKETNSGPEIVFDYRLEPFGSMVFYLPPGVRDAARGEWLPKSAPAVERPADLPQVVRLDSVAVRDDPGPSRWTEMKTGETLRAAGVYDSRFIFYRAKISTPAPTNLLVELPAGDAVIAEINGEPAAQIAGAEGKALFSLPAGDCDVRLLYENHGHANGGDGMEQSGGIRAARLTGRNFGAGRPIGGWRMQLVSGTGERPETRTEFDDSGWKSVPANQEDCTQLKPAECAVFRAGVELGAADLNGATVALRFKRIDDRGWICVNGENVGKADDWSHPWSFDITKNLHIGRNVVSVVVQNDGGGGGIGLPEIAVTSGGATVELGFLGRPAGDDGQWWSPAPAQSDWTSLPLDKAALSAQKDPLLTWYRMSFSLPQPRPGIWVPWHLHLAAAGNGFLYLNGHALGRYWNDGPQRDFYLPESWLHFGGQTNNLTLDLRPVSGGAGIRSAAVEPYPGFAERR